MLTKMIEFMIVSKKEEKVAVHCSAGVGRTGTTIALTHLIVNYYAQVNAGVEPKLSVFSTVRRIRESRLMLVQTID